MTQRTIIYTYGDGTKRSRINIVADSGKLLTSDGGETVYTCVDVDSVTGSATQRRCELSREVQHDESRSDSLPQQNRSGSKYHDRRGSIDRC